MRFGSCLSQNFLVGPLKNVIFHLDPLLMSVGPETLPTGGTGCLSNIVEGLRLKMKIDEVMAILRFGPSIFRCDCFFFQSKKVEIC